MESHQCKLFCHDYGNKSMKSRDMLVVKIMEIDCQHSTSLRSTCLNYREGERLQVWCV